METKTFLSESEEVELSFDLKSLILFGFKASAFGETASEKLTQTFSRRRSVQQSAAVTFPNKFPSSVFLTESNLYFFFMFILKFSLISPAIVNS
jgi:hypothetical protein